jgi:hypothetical protein
MRQLLRSRKKEVKTFKILFKDLLPFVFKQHVIMVSNLTIYYVVSKNNMIKNKKRIVKLLNISD